MTTHVGDRFYVIFPPQHVCFYSDHELVAAGVEEDLDAAVERDIEEALER
jgi:hypothetical protein